MLYEKCKSLWLIKQFIVNILAILLHYNFLPGIWLYDKPHCSLISYIYYTVKALYSQEICLVIHIKIFFHWIPCMWANINKHFVNMCMAAVV